MTRASLRARLHALEVRKGAALEVWQAVEDAPGYFRQVFPRVGATSELLPPFAPGPVLRREEVEARKVARLIFVEYVASPVPQWGRK